MHALGTALPSNVSMLTGVDLITVALVGQNACNSSASCKKKLTENQVLSGSNENYNLAITQLIHLLVKARA